MPASVPFTIRAAHWLVVWKWGLLIVAIVLTATLAGPASRLSLDESIESFYAEGDPYLEAYRDSKATFGGDEFVMVAYSVDHPTSESHLRETRELSGKLSSVPGVRAESTQDLASTLRNPRAEGIFRVALRLPMTERALMELSRRMLIGDDGRTVAILLRLEEESASPVSRTETFRRIRAIVAESRPDAVVAGEPIQVHDMFRYVEDDGWVLGFASSALLMLVILVFFRNPRWVVLPIVVIQATLIWTRGLLSYSEIKLSMVSSMLTSLVTIIGIATVMHITVTFREFRRDHDRQKAFEQTFVRLASPIFWTCLTTAIGFLSLTSSSITPVNSFGLMMTVGTLLVLGACVFILPGGILIGRHLPDPAAPWGEELLIRKLESLGEWSVRHTSLVVAGTLALVGVFGWGLQELTVETDFSKNFRERSPIVQALHFMERNLGGVGTWDIAFDAPAELTEDYIDRVRRLTEDLRGIELEDGVGLTKVISLSDGLDLVPRLPVSGGSGGGLLGMIPRFRPPTLEERLDLVDGLQPEMKPSLYNPEKGRMRILLRAQEQRPAEVKLKLIDEVERVARVHFPEARAAGLYVLLAYLISSLLQDQLVSFLIAASGVSLTMAVAFRSLRIGVISLIPNVLPILLVVGGIGLLRMPVNIGTAMIASVSMGLAVDSTIHYVSTYDRFRRQGADHLGAVRAAHGSVGMALTLANIALILGFSVLTLSNFVPLIYFGVLVSVAMLGGLLGNLILLPVTLRLRKPSPDWTLAESTPVNDSSESAEPTEPAA